MKKTVSFIILASFMCLQYAPAVMAHVDKTVQTTRPMSGNDLTALWGEPLKKIFLERGVEKWVYALHTKMEAYQVYVIKNNRIVERGLQPIMIDWAMVH
jgi:hypothetical protein